jgi:hypothetical protein
MVLLMLRSERLDLRIQTALMSCSLVFVDDAFVRHAVNNRHSLSVGCLSLLYIATFDGGQNVLDIGANERTEAGIV